MLPSVPDFLEELALLGGSISAERGALRVRGPRHVWTPSFREYIRRHKSGLLAALVIKPSDAPGSHSWRASTPSAPPGPFDASGKPRNASLAAPLPGVCALERVYRAVSYGASVEELTRAVAVFVSLCDSEAGYHDKDDPFADAALLVLEGYLREMDRLTATIEDLLHRRCHACMMPAELFVNK